MKDPHQPTASAPCVPVSPYVKSKLSDWCKREFNGRAGGRVRTKDGSIIIIENQSIYVPHLRLENSYTAWGKEGRLKSLSPSGTFAKRTGTRRCFHFARFTFCRGYLGTYSGTFTTINKRQEG